jgi:3-dehydroquinate synthase
MITESYQIQSQKINFYFEESIQGIDRFSHPENTIFITDENIFSGYAGFFENRKVILIPPGEDSKSFKTIETIIGKLIALQVNKDCLLVGMGGGVVTDITGFAAAIYMRGVHFAFIPTSLLAMVDAAIGGKNGISFGSYKNIIGTIQQPDWIFFDQTLLNTLPPEEWIHGFAEIIKYAVVLDRNLYLMLEQYSLEEFKENPGLTAKILHTCTQIKAHLVEQDVLDKGNRRLLNFGHTAGHAIEKLENIPHGFAVAKGMVIALQFSEEILSFQSSEKERVLELIRKYHLPTAIQCSKHDILSIIQMDKKREKDSVNFILVKSIGEGFILPLPMQQLKDLFEKII